MRAAIQDAVVDNHGPVKPVPAGIQPFKPKPMSVKDAQKAADAIGKMSVKIGRLKGFAGLGDYLSQIGVMAYGRGLLVFTAEQASASIVQCDKLYKTTEDADVKTSLIRLKRDLQGQLLQAGHEIVESARVDAAQGNGVPTGNKSFTPGEKVFTGAAVQLNVNVGGASPPADEKTILPS